jgi:H+/Cl- antiporter ClcA
MIFGGSVVGHLFGASVGREGAALQMAGSVTDTAARAGRLSDDERRILIAASLAAAWGAIYTVPITGVVFALQMCRHQRRRVIVPAVIAAFAGKWVVRSFDYRLGNRPQLPRTDWTFGLPFKLALTGVAVGLLGRLFVSSLKFLKIRMAHHFHWPPIRTMLGGAATLLLMVVFGREYLGLSTPLLANAIAGGHVDIWVPLLKLVFTVVALGTGFVGGEVAPLFVMGSTMGAAIAPALHAPSQLLATTGSTAAFASAASVILTGVVLTVEQFGWHALVPALIVGGFARLAAGRPGLYVAH